MCIVCVYVCVCAWCVCACVMYVCIYVCVGHVRVCGISKGPKGREAVGKGCHCNDIRLRLPFFNVE